MAKVRKAKKIQNKVNHSVIVIQSLVDALEYHRGHHQRLRDALHKRVDIRELDPMNVMRTTTNTEHISEKLLVNLDIPEDTVFERRNIFHDGVVEPVIHQPSQVNVDGHADRTASSSTRYIEPLVKFGIAETEKNRDQET